MLVELEVLEKKNLSFHNIFIQDFKSLEELLENHELSSISYNGKKFSSIKLIDLSKIQNLSNIFEKKKDILFIVHGDFILKDESIKVLLAENNSLICNSKIFNQKIKLQLQNFNQNQNSMQIINLEISNLYSNLILNDNFHSNVYFELNDQCEINGLKFIFHDQKNIKKIFNAQYKKNIILQNLEFQFSENNIQKNVDEPQLIELYHCERFLFSNNFTNSKNINLLKISGIFDEFSIIRSSIKNESKIIFFNLFKFFLKNLNLNFKSQNIQNIFLLNNDSILDLEANQACFQRIQDLLILVDYQNFNQDFELIKLIEKFHCENENQKKTLSFFGFKNNLNLKFIKNNYFNCNINFLSKNTLHFNNEERSIVYSKNYSKNSLILNFFSCSIKILNIKKEINEIYSLENCKVSYIKTSKNKDDLCNDYIFTFPINSLDKNIWRWENNNFYILDYSKHQGAKKTFLFKIGHEVNWHEIQEQFLKKNNFHFDSENFNIFDKNFLINKIFSFEKYLDCEEWWIKVFFIKNKDSNKIIDIAKSFLKESIHKKFLLIFKKNNILQCIVFDPQEKIFYNDEDIKNPIYCKVHEHCKIPLLDLFCI